MLKLRTRILVGGAVAVVAGATAFAVTGTADAAGPASTTALTTTAKTGTALSISATPASVAPGHATAITGVLTASGRPLRHRIVSLDRYDSATRKWVRVAVKLTGPRGGVRFVREPSATAAFELVYQGTPRLNASRSSQATITVTAASRRTTSCRRTRAAGGS